MASAPIIIHAVNDTRQFQRELKMISGEEKARLEARLDRGLPVAWIDEEWGDGIVTLTPRMCYG